MRTEPPPSLPWAIGTTPPGAGLYQILSTDYQATLRAIAQAGKTEVELKAEADARRIELAATATAKETREVGEAEAAAAQAKGEAEGAAIRAKGLAEAEAIAKRAEALEKESEAVIGQQIAEQLPEIVRAASESFRHVDNLTVLNGAQGLGEILNQVIGQAGPALDLAKQTVRSNGNGAGPAPASTIPVRDERTAPDEPGPEIEAHASDVPEP